MLSPHLSALELWNIITNNDSEGLKRAIFILGVKIHCTPLWLNCTAIVFAIRLGHLDQAKLLLNDLSQYPWSELQEKFFPDDEDIILLAKEVLKYCESDPQFVMDIFHKFISGPDDKWLHLIIGQMFDADAFTLLESLAVSRKWSIPAIIKHSFECGKLQIIQMSESISQHPAYLTENESQNELRLAIMVSDPAIVKRLVTEGETAVNEINDIFKLPDFLDLLIRLDDVAMFQMLLGKDLIKSTLALTNIKLQKLLHFALNKAVQHQSCSIIRAVLDNIYFDSELEDWLYLYYGAVTKARWRSAAAIEERVDFTNQEHKDDLFEQFGEWDGLEEVPVDLQVDDLHKIIDVIENLPTERPQPGSVWRRHVTNFPMKRRRPDLVEVFRQKYGPLQYTENDVLNKMERRLSFVDLFVNEKMYMDGFKLPLVAFVGETNTQDPIAIDAEFVDNVFDPNTEGIHAQSWDLLVELVLTTGKRIILDNSSNLDEADFDEAQNVVEKLNGKRVEASTLQKLCRLSIRQTMVSKIVASATVKTCDWQTLHDAIISLYVDEYLPMKPLVNFLLYREDNVLRPLYYRLVDLNIINA